MPAQNGTPVRYPRRRVIRGLFKVGIAAALAPLAHLEVIGRDNIPVEGPLLVVGNHFSFLDPVLMILLLPFVSEFVAGSTQPNAPVWATIFPRLYGTLRIQRGTSSRDGLLAAESLLKQKGVLTIFPEAGSWAKVLRPARPGAALLASRTPAKILPVGLDGVPEVFPPKMGKRARVTIRFGKPFGPLSLERGNGNRSNRELLDDIGHQIMHKIAELIPPEKRGVYSDDPAIREAARDAARYPWELTAEG